MNNNFRGWATVFAFTFRQSTKKAFKIVTALVAILIIGFIIIINIIAAKPDQEEQNTGDHYYGYEVPSGISSIKKVFILDQSGLPPTDYIARNPGLSAEHFKHIEFITSDKDTRSELLNSAALDSDRTIAVMISEKDTVLEMEALIPHNSVVVKDDVDSLIDHMASSFEGNKLMLANLSDQELTAVFTPILTSYSELGESSNQIAMVIKMLTPMVFSFMMYFMLLLYGQTVSKSVSTEKTSKLMETLLTSIHPYAMIIGKVLAVTSQAILQFVIWILAGIIGLYSANMIAHSIYPSYENTVIEFINLIKSNIGETGMTIPAILLAVLIFSIGFMFYCVLAALAGCMVSKPEDVASTQGLFQLPIIISWLITYIAPITGNTKLLSIARYIPFTAPFCVPGDLIAGAIGLGEGLLSLLALTAFSFIIIIISAKIYKGLVLYNGQKVNMRVLANIFKG